MKQREKKNIRRSKEKGNRGVRHDSKAEKKEDFSAAVFSRAN